MIKQTLFYLMVSFSMFFLFVKIDPTFLNSNFLYYAFSGVSFLVILSFFYYYNPVFKAVIKSQLQSMQTKTSASWSSWISENINEFSTIFLIFTPYIIGIASMSNGLSIWFEFLSFLPIVSLIIMIIFNIFMVFLFITTIYSWIFERNKPESFSFNEMEAADNNTGVLSN